MQRLERMNYLLDEWKGTKESQYLDIETIYCDGHWLSDLEIDKFFCWLEDGNKYWDYKK